LSTATNYQQNCAICHTSQLRANPTSADPMQHATYLEPGVDCEMCHGPGARHARLAAKGTLDHADAAEPPFDFRRADHRDGVRVCAQCHEQSAVREIGAQGEMNYSTAGTYIPQSRMRSFDAFSRRAFYKDGRFRETTFIVEAFTRSACYRRGTAQCASCHSPHSGDFEHNPTSLKHISNPNEMCLGCHAEYWNQIAEHSRHLAGSEASRCVTCHMPRIVNAVLFQARSHQIEIPTADLTERFGQEESPNVCLTCHAEKTPAWVSARLVAWRQ
jgi:predicted CXXCH cytochrome family protein